MLRTVSTHLPPSTAIRTERLFSAEIVATRSTALANSLESTRTIRVLSLGITRG